jgi:hypothetical protein
MRKCSDLRFLAISPIYTLASVPVEALACALPCALWPRLARPRLSRTLGTAIAGNRALK